MEYKLNNNNEIVFFEPIRIMCGFDVRSTKYIHQYILDHKGMTEITKLSPIFYSGTISGPTFTYREPVTLFDAYNKRGIK